MILTKTISREKEPNYSIDDWNWKPTKIVIYIYILYVGNLEREGKAERNNQGRNNNKAQGKLVLITVTSMSFDFS